MSEQPDSTAGGAATRPCPICAETIKAAAIKCRFCGEDLADYVEEREAEIERDLFVGRPATIYSVGQLLLSILTLGIMWVYFWVKHASLKYYITTQRIRIEQGILSKSKSNLELYRMDDFVINSPFGMRLLGYAILTLKSSDRDVEDVHLYGIKNTDALADKIRAHALKERERRNIRVWANA